MMIVPTLRQLEYFVAVIDHGAFHSAAKACGVSQPGLSAQLQELERQLGVVLVERARPKVLPTEAGAALLERARALLLGAQDLTEAARTHARPFTGPLRLGVIPTVAPYLLPSAVPALRNAHPDLRLFIHEDETDRLLEQLERGHMDLLLLSLDAQLGDVARLAVFDDAFQLAVPTDHCLARRKWVRESEIAGEALLLLEDGHCLRDQVLDLCHATGASESTDFRASSLGTLVQMVAGGEGITLLPSMSIEIEGRHANLATIPFRRPAPARTIGLAWRKTSPRGAEFEALAPLFRPPKRQPR